MRSASVMKLDCIASMLRVKCTKSTQVDIVSPQVVRMGSNIYLATREREREVDAFSTRLCETIPLEIIDIPILSASVYWSSPSVVYTKKNRYDYGGEMRSSLR
jgi:hypothetical protein